MSTRLVSRYMLALTALAVVVAVAVGCASSPDQYKLAKYVAPPPGSPSAEIYSLGGVLRPSPKGLLGTVVTIDETVTPSFSKVVRVAPGLHRVAINCLFTGPSWGGSLLESFIQHVVATGTIVADSKYYVRCDIIDAKPRAWLSTSSDGADLPPGFESMCAQSCDGFP